MISFKNIAYTNVFILLFNLLIEIFYRNLFFTALYISIEIVILFIFFRRVGLYFPERKVYKYGRRLILLIYILHLFMLFFFKVGSTLILSLMIPILPILMSVSAFDIIAWTYQKGFSYIAKDVTRAIFCPIVNIYMYALFFRCLKSYWKDDYNCISNHDRKYINIYLLTIFMQFFIIPVCVAVLMQHY